MDVHFVYIVLNIKHKKVSRQESLFIISWKKVLSTLTNSFLSSPVITFTFLQTSKENLIMLRLNYFVICSFTFQKTVKSFEWFKSRKRTTTNNGNFVKKENPTRSSLLHPLISKKWLFTGIFHNLTVSHVWLKDGNLTPRELYSGNENDDNLDIISNILFTM